MNRDWDKLRRQDKAKKPFDHIATFRPKLSRKLARKHAQRLKGKRHFPSANAMQSADGTPTVMLRRDAALQIEPPEQITRPGLATSRGEIPQPTVASYPLQDPGSTTCPPPSLVEDGRVVIDGWGSTVPGLTPNVFALNRVV